MENCLIHCENVHLTIPLYKSRKFLDSNPLKLFSGLYGFKNSRGEKCLLEKIDFRLMEGESIGVMGSNGAGKTTLLRLLAGVYEPSAGTLITHGTSYGLFNVQAGMKPEASGIENIYLRGLQMGLGFSEIGAALEEVQEFADIGEAIHDPLNSYSNGMRMRLALAISTMINPDILLLDEWIGAGDQEFRKKINDRMMELVANSKGLMLATHNRDLMSKLCNKGIVMQDGTIKFYGPIEDALEFRKKQVADMQAAKQQ